MTKIINWTLCLSANGGVSSLFVNIKLCMIFISALQDVDFILRGPQNWEDNICPQVLGLVSECTEMRWILESDFPFCECFVYVLWQDSFFFLSVCCNECM